MIRPTFSITVSLSLFSLFKDSPQRLWGWMGGYNMVVGHDQSYRIFKLRTVGIAPLRHTCEHSVAPPSRETVSVNDATTRGDRSRSPHGEPD